MSHFLQKPIESLCGFLTVLPGAFSAFRWAAIEGEPLRRYFYGLYSQVGPENMAGATATANNQWSSIAALALLRLPVRPVSRSAAPRCSRVQADLSAFEANMYLAEDRVLCLEIVARKNSRY